MPKMRSQYPRIREYRQYRVHDFGAMLPILPVLGYWAIMLGILEVQVYWKGPKYSNHMAPCKYIDIILLLGPKVHKRDLLWAVWSPRET